MMNAPSNHEFASNESSIGTILVQSGRIKAEDVERVSRLQQEENLRFGDAAIKLGLATLSDIQFALSRQYDYPYLQRGESRVSEMLIAAYNPFSPQVEALRALRSQLILRFGDARMCRKSLAIVSAEDNAGRSWLAANLAVIFSQLGERTLLIDADLRQPSQHVLFGLENQVGLSNVLSGRSKSDSIVKIPDLIGLSVLTSGPIPPNPQELLERQMLPQLLEQYSESFDVVIIDTPSANQAADCYAVASRAGGALLVGRKNRSRVSDMRALVEKLSETGVGIVGSVLNDG